MAAAADLLGEFHGESQFRDFATGTADEHRRTATALADTGTATAPAKGAFT